jgi:two-component system phosphate regulon sensor histidine kinase PhoR
MLAGIAGESPGPENDSIFTYLSHPDTGLVRKFFTRSLSDHNFKTEWSPLPTADTLIQRDAALYFRSGLPGQGILVRVTHFRYHLIRQMIANFAFALVLLSLTGAAFVISFRSLKKQTLLTRMRNDFVGNITHELKTPISTAKVALEAIGHFGVKEDPVRREAYLDIVSQELDRLEQLTGSVLASSVYEGNHTWIIVQPVDVKDIAGEVMDAVRERLAAEGAAIYLETEGTNFMLRADRLHVRGALMNLVDNSLKYGKNPVIRIRINGRGNLPRIVFTDNGPGIPGEYLDKVFERFFRVPMGDVHNVKGYGLGLAYVKAVMEQHGGTATVMNNPDGGCSFILQFE